MIEKNQEHANRVREIVAQARKLPPDARAEIVEEVLASLEDEDGELLDDPEWLAEMGRRASEAAQAIRDGQPGTPAEELIARLRAKHGS